jgi:DNA polymerase-3 subunit epsilon
MLLFPKKRKTGLPSYWKHYEQLNRKSFPSGTPVDSLTFSIVDVESTGLNPKKDKMIAFAATRIHHLKLSIKSSMEIVIRQEKPIRNEAVPIHQLIHSDLQTGFPEDKAVEQIIQFIGRSILVGYHVHFDLAMINQTIQRILGKKLLNPVINVPDLIRRIEDPVHSVFPSNSADLKQQCDLYGIDVSDQHTAAGDAFATAQLFLKVLTKLEKRGIHTWRGLYKK